jgi:hypothetical protein
MFRKKGFGTPDPAKRVEIKAELIAPHKRILDFFAFPRFDRPSRITSGHQTTPNPTP